MIAVIGCSVYETRLYSEPVDHLQTPKKNSAVYNINPGLQRFEHAETASVFTDSLSETSISIQLKNEFRKGMIGPVLIPLVPVTSGYGSAQKKINRGKEDDDRNVIVELTIRPGKNDSVSFIPSFFCIEKKRKSEPVKLVAIPGITDLSETVHCTELHTWKLVFTPGVHVNELPRVFLHSLKINKKEFYPEGIPFKIGKRSFYSPIVTANA